MDKELKKEYIEYHRKYVRREKRETAVMMAVGYTVCVLNVALGIINTQRKSYMLAALCFIAAVLVFKSSTDILKERKGLHHIENLVDDLERDLQNEDN